MTSGAVSIRNVSKAFGAFRALDDVSLDIKPGEFLTLLGPSGSGKTTLLNVIAGFERPDNGSLMVDGVEFITRPPHKRDLGMVFQNYALFPHMDVFNNVAYPLKLRRREVADIRERVKQALDVVQMAHLSARRITELSGGQKQRVALARAIVFEPKLLLMDEPLSALDKNLREHMQIELKRLHDRLGMTTVYVTHDQQEALTMSNRIAVLRNGRIVQLDTPTNIYDRPNCHFVASFMGETKMLPVSKTSNGYELAGRRLKLAQPPSPLDEQWLMIRPERLGWQGDDERDNRIEGLVVDVVYRGDSHSISLKLPGDHEISIRRAPTESKPLPEPGQTLTLWLRPEASVLVRETSP
ncbi:ABC transporter ATP-binding protein [Mesorhizobium sp. M4A.F.Ca.ET.020.02.1.1]|uniref:ABC transporter ATP-binding protein n=1 Tax=unclassified Mesorhizobium TaxID=325217 RepID=UPI000FD3D28F|nr:MULTISPECIES: ABC transporter ATP-binding protein [unclassified Mesorhizobium]RVD37476.1 ABC transporter ATP-binding protein [Mesorhizobium sp. M4A.F.Ca.ET.020.02.1.1]RWC15558.1 MAG: ABC transporter ATP-binding protein [Mesorhizobium sp.]